MSRFSHTLRRIATLIVAAAVILPCAVYKPVTVNAVADDEMVLEVDFKTFSGDDWVVTDDNYLSSNYFTIVRDPDNDGYWYEIEYSNGNTVTFGAEDDLITYTDFLCFEKYPDYTQWNSATDGGSTSARITIHHSGDIIVNEPQGISLSEIIIDGETSVECQAHNSVYGTYTATEATRIPFVGGSTHDVTLVSPYSYDVTVYFNTMGDVVVNQDYIYNFTLGLSQSNRPLSARAGLWNYAHNIYWTVEGDDTPHYTDKPDQNYFYIRVPIGKSIVLHNVPYQCFLNSYGNGSFPAYSATGEAASAWDIQHVLPYGDTVTLGDEDFFSDNWSNYQVQYDSGLLWDMIYELDPGTVSSNAPSYTGSAPHIDTSGIFSDFGMGMNSRISVYLLRRPVEFVFSKIYDPNDTTVQTDELHTFEVTLNDSIAQAPFTERVAYYIVDDPAAAVDEDADALYATPDADGKFTVEIRAGQYVRVGRVLTEARYNEMGLALHNRSGTDTSYKNFMGEAYIPGSGSLPFGVTYSIREISDDYTATSAGDVTATLLDGYSSRYQANTSCQTIIDRLADVGITAPVFTNTRDSGSLEITKVVTGVSDQDSFDFVLALTDDGDAFPASLPYTSSTGNNGTIALTAGVVNGNSVTYTGSFTLAPDEKITINGIPSGTQFVITETDESAADFKVTYSNCTGTIARDAASTASVTNAGPTPTSTPTPTPTATVTATATPTDVPSATPTQTAAASVTPTATDTLTPTPTSTPDKGDTMTSTSTPTATPTASTTSTSVARTGEDASGNEIIACILITGSVLTLGLRMRQRRKFK